MNKDIALKKIEQNLLADEELIDFCLATKTFKLWLVFLIGPLAMLSMKYYYLAITNKGFHFHALNMLGRFSQHDFFAYNEIESLKIGSGMLQVPMRFTFNGGRKLKIGAQFRGAKSVAKINEATLIFLKRIFPQGI